MSSTIKSLTIDGVTKGVSEWAKDVGMSPTTLHGRLQRGWDPEEAIRAPAGRPTVSKNDAELALNDMTRDQLPSQLAKLIPVNYRGTKCGEVIRSSFRKEFDNWFNKVYVPNHERRVCKEKSTITLPAS